MAEVRGGREKWCRAFGGGMPAAGGAFAGGSAKGAVGCAGGGPPEARVRRFPDERVRRFLQGAVRRSAWGDPRESVRGVLGRTLRGALRWAAPTDPAGACGHPVRGCPCAIPRRARRPPAHRVIRRGRGAAEGRSDVPARRSSGGDALVDRGVGGAPGDRRDTIVAIVRLNALEEAGVAAGRRLVLPDGG
jgi:hypothetical protein